MTGRVPPPTPDEVAATRAALRLEVEAGVIARLTALEASLPAAAAARLGAARASGPLSNEALDALRADLREAEGGPR